ncbi:hypothetical protein [Plantactinospora sp. B5E13]|uniref:hypothetical protein n=1 Tax=unclassified Plantactinospora TaxID=2631981 RepID=UPI00325D6755
MLATSRPLARTDAPRPVRRSQPRAVLGAGLILLLVALGVVAAPGPASAHAKLSPGGSCPGSELSPHRDFFNGQVSVFVYYSSANGGTNCAWAQKNVGRGTAQYLNVGIGVCPTGNPGFPCEPVDFDDDRNAWEYYAGPVRVDNTAGRCIMIWAEYLDQERTIGPVHCG